MGWSSAELTAALPAREGGPRAGLHTQRGEPARLGRECRQASLGEGQRVWTGAREACSRRGGPESYHTSGLVWTTPQEPWLRNVPSLLSSCKHPHPCFEAVQSSGATYLEYRPSDPPQMLSPSLELSPSDMCLDSARRLHCALKLLAPGEAPFTAEQICFLATCDKTNVRLKTSSLFKAKTRTVWLGTRSHLLGWITAAGRESKLRLSTALHWCPLSFRPLCPGLRGNCALWASLIHGKDAAQA